MAMQVAFRPQGLTGLQSGLDSEGLFAQVPTTQDEDVVILTKAMST